MEVSVSGNGALTRGWQTFAHARGLSRWCTLYFKFDGDATLYVRVFGKTVTVPGAALKTTTAAACPAPALTRMKMATGVQAAVLGVC